MQSYHNESVITRCAYPDQPRGEQYILDIINEEYMSATDHYMIFAISTLKDKINADRFKTHASDRYPDTGFQAHEKVVQCVQTMTVACLERFFAKIMTRAITAFIDAHFKPDEIVAATGRVTKYVIDAHAFMVFRSDRFSPSQFPEIPDPSILPYEYLLLMYTMPTKVPFLMTQFAQVVRSG